MATGPRCCGGLGRLALAPAQAGHNDPMSLPEPLHPEARKHTPETTDSRAVAAQPASARQETAQPGPGYLGSGRGASEPPVPAHAVASPASASQDTAKDRDQAAGEGDAVGKPRDPEVPGWVYELVDVAAHARAILLGQRWVLAAGATGAFVLGWLGPCLLSDKLLQAAGGLLLLAVAAVVLDAASRTVPAEPLPQGARGGVHLILLDIVLTGLGLLLLGGLALAGVGQALLLAALAVLGAATGSLCLLLTEAPRRRLGAAWALGLVLVYVLALWLLGLTSWWTAAVLAVAVDLGAVAAYRLGRSAEQR